MEQKNKKILETTNHAKKENSEKILDSESLPKEIEFDGKNYTSFRVALISILVAIGIGGSYALLGIPNVEILTFVIFLSGFLYGCRIGTIVGTISEAIFAGFNPYGVAPLVTYLALIIAFAVIGFFGGLMGNNTKDLEITSWNIYKFATTGAVLTFFFDIFTALSWVIVTPGMSLYLTLILQVPFTIIHVVSNMLLFGLVMIPVISRVRTFENR
ncbi:MAG: hypothetical protein ACTSVY_10605 [Candidatus Helarchaeota archaeon]